MNARTWWVCAALAATLGCSNDGAGPSNSTVAATDIAPALDTLRSIGAEVRLVATSRTAQAPAKGVYGWTVSDTAVLQGFPVPPDTFLVRARAEGTAIVRVFEQGGTRDSARVVVRQAIARIPVSPFFAYRACPVQLVAQPQDSGGHAIGHAVNVTLASHNTSVATIGPGALLLPRGTGGVVIDATAEGVTTATTIYLSAAPVFQVGTTPFATFQIGAGQYAIATPRAPSPIDAPVTLRFRSSDSTVARLPVDTDVVPAGYQEGNGTTIVGVKPGTATVRVVACDVPTDSVTMRVTTPRIANSPVSSGSARTDDPPWTVHLTIGDSVGGGGPTFTTLPIHVFATDTAVIHPDSPYVHVPAGDYRTTSVLTWASHGTARVVFVDSAGRYPPDTTAPVSVSFPPLQLSVVTDTLSLGMRQRGSVPLGLDRPVADSALTVHVTSSDTVVASALPATISMPVGSTGSSPIVLTTHDTTGATQVMATAYRHEPIGVTVLADRPQFGLFVPVTGIPHYPGDPPGEVSVFATDSLSARRVMLGGKPTEDVTASLVSSDPSIASLDSTSLTIAAGTGNAGIAHLSFNAPGTVTITASDPRAVYYRYRPATSIPITIVPKRLVLFDSTMFLGIGQYWSDAVYIEGRIPTDLVVTLTHTNPAVAQLDRMTDTLPSYGPSGPVPLHGLLTGVDTVFATASGWLPDTMPVVVGLGTVTLASWPASLAVADSAQIYLRVANQVDDGRLVDSATTFMLTPNASLAFSSGSAPITSVAVPPGGQGSSYFYVKAIATGTGTVTITNPNYQPLTKSLAVP
jgi:hypothetical protein